MKPRILVPTLSAAILLTVSGACLGAARVPATGSGQEQTTPAAVPPQTPTPPPKPLSLEERADIFMARKNYGEAADYYQRALRQLNFRNAALWNKLGITYQQQMKYHSARKAYGKATHLKKDFAEAWNNIGTTYFMENKFGKSVKYYKRAIEAKGNDAAFHLNLGTSYYHLKKYKEAVDEYRVALGLDPNVLTQQSALGAVIRARGADVQFYYYMAKAFALNGQAEEAVRYLRRALEDGFRDQKRIEEDPDFDKIRQHPAYVELMKNPPVPIRD
jgi:tetratricopeptide (TPR) repeat protein